MNCDSSHIAVRTESCDKTAKTLPAPVQPIEFPGGPFQHVALLVLLNVHLNVHAVSIYFSCNYRHSLQTLHVKEIPVPSQPIMDTFSAFTDFLKERGIKHITTSVYHPQANGCVERYNRVLKDCIQAAERPCWKRANATRIRNKVQNYPRSQLVIESGYASLSMWEKERDGTPVYFPVSVEHQTGLSTFSLPREHRGGTKTWYSTDHQFS